MVCTKCVVLRIWTFSRLNFPLVRISIFSFLLCCLDRNLNIRKFTIDRRFLRHRPGGRLFCHECLWRPSHTMVVIRAFHGVNIPLLHKITRLSALPKRQVSVRGGLSTLQIQIEQRNMDINWRSCCWEKAYAQKWGEIALGPRIR